MSGLKKKLKPHAVTCIKQALVHCLEKNPNNGLAYTVHCDVEDCWDQGEYVPDYICAVNVREDGYTNGDVFQKTLADKTTVCAYKSSLTIDIEVYAAGCKTTADTAMSVLADVTAYLQDCDGAKEFFAKRITQRAVDRDVASDYATEIAKITSRMQVDFDYVPCRPTLVFNKYKRK